MGLAKETVYLLERVVSLLDNVNISTGFCCCGNELESHGIWCGHSPRDEGEYQASGLRQDIIEHLKGDRANGLQGS